MKVARSRWRFRVVLVVAWAAVTVGAMILTPLFGVTAAVVELVLVVQLVRSKPISRAWHSST